MGYLIIVIILLIIIGAIISTIEDLADYVGGIGPLILIVIVIVLISKLGIWLQAICFIAICALIGAIGFGIMSAINYIGDQVEQHDRMRQTTALIEQQTKANEQMHKNDAALIEELSKNCYWLGYMNDDMWLKKLPNYVQRQYSTSFKTITSNFAKQAEQQYILQNDDWFEPFKKYILEHPGGATVTKMLHEVNCPQLKMTHCTPDGDLLNTWLTRGTKKANKDVPALFSATFIKEMNENVFTPTPYLKKLYGVNDNSTQEVSHVTEMKFDDL